MSAGEGSRAETPGWLLLVVWCVIVALGVLSLVMRFARIGAYGYLVAFLVAGIQATLLAVFFMELAREAATVKMAFAACLALFAILVAFVVADVLTRPQAPLENPPGTAPRAHG